MGLQDGILLSIQICSIGQWGKNLVMVMEFLGTFEHGRFNNIFKLYPNHNTNLCDKLTEISVMYVR